MGNIKLIAAQIYLMVPTTILQSDDPHIQREVLKRWIAVSEVSNTINIINPYVESNVYRRSRK